MYNDVRQPFGAMNHANQINGVGGIWDTLASVVMPAGTAVIDYGMQAAGITVGTATTTGSASVPKPTFGSALGGEVGKTFRYVVFGALALGVGYWFLTKQNPVTKIYRQLR